MVGGLFRKEKPFLADARDGNRIERKSGGGCLAVFGIPFFLAGLYVLMAGFGLAGNVSRGAASSAAVVLFGLVFTAVGGFLIFGRSGVVIDRAQNQFIQWYGLIVPMKRIVHPLDQFDVVRLDRTHKDKTTFYPVRLVSTHSKAAVTIEQPSDVQQARRTSEELARFLGKPMEDLSIGKKVVRDPDHLNESFRDRVRRLKEDDGFFPPQPFPMQTRIEQTPEGIILFRSDPSIGGVPLFHLAVTFGVAVFALTVLLPGLLSLPLPQMVYQLFGGFILFFMVLLPILKAVIAFIRSRGQFTRVTATRAFLRLEEKKGGKTTVLEIPADELEEVTFTDKRSLLARSELPGMEKGKEIGDTGTPRLPDGRPVPKMLLSLMRLVPSQGITARSDKTTLTFGKGLPDDELVFLHALIRKTLTD